jgi:hypothetical protein
MKTLYWNISVPDSSLKTWWQELLMKPVDYSLCVSSIDCVKPMKSSPIPDSKSSSCGTNAVTSSHL